MRRSSVICDKCRGSIRDGDNSLQLKIPGIALMGTDVEKDLCTVCVGNMVQWIDQSRGVAV